MEGVQGGLDEAGTRVPSDAFQRWRLSPGIRLRPENFGGLVFDRRSGRVFPVGKALFAALTQMQAATAARAQASTASSHETPCVSVLEDLETRGVLIERRIRGSGE